MALDVGTVSGTLSLADNFSSALDAATTRMVSSFASISDGLSKVATSIDSIASKLASVAPRIKQPADDADAAAQRLQSTYARLAASIDPVIASEQKMAAATTTLNSALQTGLIDETEYASAIEKATAKFDANATATRSLSSEVSRITSALDPAAAAQNKYASTQNTLGAALKAGVIDLEQHNSMIEKAGEKYLTSGAAASTFHELVEGVTAIAGSCGQAVSEMSEKLEGASSKFSSLGAVVGELGPLLPIVLAIAAAVAVLAIGFEAFKVSAEFLEDVIVEGAKTEVVVQGLNNTLRATGSAAGYTSAQLIGQAESLSLVSGTSKEAAIQGEAILAKFTTIGHDVLPAAALAAQNLAAQSNGTIDLSRAYTLVGQALSGPGKGMAALRDAGIVLNAGQMATLKQLQLTGNQAEYQATIMRLLASSTAGAAEAYGNTLTGQVGRAQNVFKNFKETIASEVIPALEDNLSELVKQVGGSNDMVEAWKNINDNIKLFAHSVGDAIRAMVDGSIIAYNQFTLALDTAGIAIDKDMQGFVDSVSTGTEGILHAIGTLTHVDMSGAISGLNDYRVAMHNYFGGAIDEAVADSKREQGAIAAAIISYQKHDQALEGSDVINKKHGQAIDDIATKNDKLTGILNAVTKAEQEYSSKVAEQDEKLAATNSSLIALSASLDQGVSAYNDEVAAQSRVLAINTAVTEARKNYDAQVITLTGHIKDLQKLGQTGEAAKVKSDIDALTKSYGDQIREVTLLAGTNSDLAASNSAKRVLADEDVAASNAQRIANAALADSLANDNVASRALTVQLTIEAEIRKNTASVTGLSSAAIAAKISQQQKELDITTAANVAQQQVNAFLLDYNKLLASTSDDTTKIALQREYGTTVAQLVIELGGASTATRALAIEEAVRLEVVKELAEGEQVDIDKIRLRITAMQDATAAMKDGLALASASADVWKPLQDGFTSALTAGQTFLNTFVETGKIDFATLGKSLLDTFLKTFESILANWVQLQVAMAAASATGSQIGSGSSGSGIVSAIAGSAGSGAGLTAAATALTGAGTSLSAAAAAMLSAAGVHVAASTGAATVLAAAGGTQALAGGSLLTSSGLLATSSGVSATSLLGSGTALTFSATALDSAAVSLGSEGAASSATSLAGGGGGGLLGNLGSFFSAAAPALAVALVPALILGFANADSQTTVHPYTFGGYSIGNNRGANGGVDDSSVGSAGSVGYSKQPGDASDTQITNALKSFFATFQTTTNSFITSLPQIGVRILQGGKQFEAEFAGQILGLYNSESDAINAAIIAGLHSASFANLPGVIQDYVKTATDSTSASYQSDPSAIMANVQTLQDITDQAGGAISQVTTDMRGFFSTASDFDTKIMAMGLSAADTATELAQVNSGLLANLTSERNNLIGVTTSAKQKQALDIATFNAQIDMAVAQLKMNNNQLEMEALGLAGQGAYINGLGEVVRATVDGSTIMAKSAEVVENANQTQIDNINALIDSNTKLEQSENDLHINAGDVKGPEGGGGASSSNSADILSSALDTLNTALQNLAEQGMGAFAKSEYEIEQATQKAITAAKGNKQAIADLIAAEQAQMQLLDEQTTANIWTAIKPLIQQANGLSSFQVSFQGVIDQFAQYYSDAKAAGDTTAQLGRITKAEKQAEYNLIMSTVQQLNLPLDQTLQTANLFSNAVQALQQGLADGTISLDSFNNEMQQIAQQGESDILNMIEDIYTSVGNTKAAEQIKEELQEVNFRIQLAQLEVLATSLYKLGDISLDLYNQVLAIEDFYDNPANQPNWAAINAAASASSASVNDSASSIADALKTLADSFETAKANIQKTVDGLLAGTSGGAAPDAAFAAASSQWQAELAKAQTGDLASLQAAPQDAQDYITALKAYSPELFKLQLPQIEKSLEGLTQLTTVHDSSTGLTYSEQTTAIAQQTMNASLTNIDAGVQESNTTLDTGFNDLSTTANQQRTIQSNMANSLNSIVRLQSSLNAVLVRQGAGQVGNKRPIMPTSSGRLT